MPSSGARTRPAGTGMRLTRRPYGPAPSRRRPLAVGRDLPEVAVRVAEIPEVPTPLGGCRLLHDAATGRDGVADDLVDNVSRRDDAVERDATEPGPLGGDAGVGGRRVPFVEGQRRRSVAQAERHEAGIVLVDRAAQAFPVELLGAVQVPDADHDGGHLQRHGCLLFVSCAEHPTCMTRAGHLGVTGPGPAGDPVPHTRGGDEIRTAPARTRLCFRRMTMELRHLRCFLAIAEEGTLTRAATRLDLTQPVVSRTLRQLEDHLGVRLIDRSTHYLGLTAAGHAFQIRAASAVAAADAAFDPGRLGAWPLRLGHAWFAFGEFTVSLLRSWLQEYPDVPLELRRIEDRTAGLIRGEVDAALLRGPVTTPGIRTEPLTRADGLTVSLAWTHPPTHPAIAKLVTLA